MKKLTKPQTEALKVIRENIGRFPIADTGSTLTGLSTRVLASLEKLGYIRTESIFLGGRVRGLQLVG